MNRLIVISAALLIGCGGKEKASDSGESTVPVSCDDVGIDIPGGRGEISGAWDPKGKRLLMFGGNQAIPENCGFGASDFLDETWAYKPDCGGFVRISPPESPQARGRHTTVYDSDRHAILIHGGRYRDGGSGEYTVFGDTWSFDLNTDTWSKLAGASGGPTKRVNHAAAYARGKMYIMGGNDSDSAMAFTPTNDTWAFDPASATWQKLTTTNKPPVRLYHPMTTDGDRLYIYGGGDENALFSTEFLNDVWALDLDTLAWTELNPGTGNNTPDSRFWGSLVHDAAKNRLVAFGGHDSSTVGNSNQLWEFTLDNNKWNRLEKGDTLDNTNFSLCDFPSDFTKIDDASPERRNAGATALTDRGEMLIFGGKTDCGNANDVWSLNLSSDVWTDESRATEGEVCLRAYQECSAMCF